MTKDLLSDWQNESAIANLFENNRRDITQLIQRLLEAKDAECEERKKVKSPGGTEIQFHDWTEKTVDSITLSEHKKQMREAAESFRIKDGSKLWTYGNAGVSILATQINNQVDELLKKYGVDEAE